MVLKCCSPACSAQRTRARKALKTCGFGLRVSNSKGSLKAKRPGPSGSWSIGYPVDCCPMGRLENCLQQRGTLVDAVPRRCVHLNTYRMFLTQVQMQEVYYNVYIHIHVYIYTWLCIFIHNYIYIHVQHYKTCTGSTFIQGTYLSPWQKVCPKLSSKRFEKWLPSAKLLALGESGTLLEKELRNSTWNWDRSYHVQ